MKTKKCITCGKKFTAVIEHPTVSYCSYECAQSHLQDFQNKYVSKFKNKDKDSQK